VTHIRSSQAAPPTKRATDWRASAACREEDPELFHPIGTSTAALQDTEQARAICRRCPVVADCLDYALNAPVHDGIFGGLTEKERAKIRRAKARRASTPVLAQRAAVARRPPTRPRTLQSIYDENTTLLRGDHYVWTGTAEIRFKGRKYTPHRLAFTLDRGHYAEGKVQPGCGVPGCVTGRHLTDGAERAARPSARATA
jgi:transcription factor WhiB